jgi:hypothetical protein
MAGIDGWWDGLVRDRAEAVLELVLSAIADDYENLETILASVNERERDFGPEAWPARRAVPVSRPEVVSALKELTREGYAQAWVLDSHEPQARPVKFREEEVVKLWFLATPRGAAAAEKLFERISSNS